MRQSRVQSLAASPVMVGAITTLIVIVAVFLAYNASTGLPFVPVYRISAELPNAQRLAPNNEVRVGGFRVGVIESIEPKRNTDAEGNGAPSVIAKVNLKLDKSVDPLPADTEVRVRYKSSFGLKYLELTRGTGRPLPEGAVIPVTQASSQTEFDDINNTFDRPTRAASRQNLLGYGSAFAARGASLNETVQNLNPLFENLKPVAETLIADRTRLERFFPALAKTAAIVAPVADQQAELFGNMAATFGALSEDPEALKDTISSGVPTLEEGTPALAAQRPFLTSFAELSTRLRPGVQAMRTALPTLNDALEIGAPVIRRTPAINEKLEGVLEELEQLLEQPQTETTLLRLRETFDEAAPLARWVAPYQTVCNYWNYWFTFLPEHLTERDPTGFTQRVSIIGVPSQTEGQVQSGLGGYSGISANGRAGPTGFTENPELSNGEFAPHELPILHGNPYGPAIDSRGRADCQSGQNGYILSGAPEYRVRGQALDNPSVGVTNLPGSLGPTFAGRAKLPGRLQPRELP
jgi:virulence factor Mce-like protein